MEKRRWIPAMAAGVVGFFGLLTGLNLLAGRWMGATQWWLDLRWMPAWMAAVFQCLVAGTFVAISVMGLRRGIRRVWAIATIAAVIAIAMANAAIYFRLVAAELIRPTGLAVPLSGVVAVGLGVALAILLREPQQVSDRRKRWLGAVIGAGVCAVLFPLGQMYCFGKTDYRRQASAAVVFGARAYSDGRPSDALADRVRTGCELYREGWVDFLIFSGGPGDGEIHETESMRRMAVDLGVPEAAIVIDDAGLNTEATVQHTAELLREQNIGRVLAVSHFYHLPRVKMTYQQAGMEVYTVPAKERYTLTKMPWLMAREVAAFWVYWARGMG
jgi:uncharacterized SAM-binding protein YcdF (DUF218 family)